MWLGKLQIGLLCAGLLIQASSSHGQEPILDSVFRGESSEWLAKSSSTALFGESGLQLKSSGGVRYTGDSKELSKQLKSAGAMSLEVWIQPDGLGQVGPARILTFSKNANERNFTLGQNGDRIEARLRTDKRSKNGTPGLDSNQGKLAQALTHVVFTVSQEGNTVIFLNGEVAGRQRVQGTFKNWNDGYQLLIGDEASGGRPWKGRIFRVAIFDRSLNASEVNNRFSKGIGGEMQKAVKLSSSDRNAELFETKIATILTKHCLECHDSVNQKGDLDLSKSLASHFDEEILVAGNADDSLLWESIESDEMPKKRDPISDEEKELVKKWIEGGASWTIDFIDPAIYSRPADNATPWARRLTVSEYINTVRDTLGVDIEEEAGRLLPPDIRADGFSNTAYNLSVDFKHIDAYVKLANLIVAKMDLEAFSKRFTKNRELTDKNMIVYIEALGQFVLRGPVKEEEKALYRGITTTTASMNGGFIEATGHLLEAMIQSPRFLYRIERQHGIGDKAFADDFELASRISYTLWGSSPDEELLRLAEKGELNHSKVLSQQTQRMLKDPRAIERSLDFVSEWLHLDRLSHIQPNPLSFPDWKPELAQAMKDETLTFFQEVVWNEKLPMAALFNTPYSFMTPELADHYGMPTQSSGKGKMTKHDLTGIPERGGILTQGSLLTIGGDEASMVTRGLFVLNDLLRGVINDPPPSVNTEIVASEPGLSKREIGMGRVSDKTCGGCHVKFEPLAYGLEKFDGLGSFEEIDEHGNVLREDGEVAIPGDSEPVGYGTVAELMDLLAASSRVQETVTWKMTQFAMGRPLNARDAATVNAIHRGAMEAGGRYEDVMSAIVRSDLIRYLAPEPLTDESVSH